MADVAIITETIELTVGSDAVSVAVSETPITVDMAGSGGEAAMNIALAAASDATTAKGLAEAANSSAQVAAANAALYGQLFYNAGPGPFELMAHRGFADMFPENTMAAFTAAVGLGCRSLELDVQISSDGVPVVIHDSTVDRTTDGTGNVKDKTLAELQALDAGSHFNAKFAGAKIPTFAEVVEFAAARGVTLYAEIKDYRTQADIDLIMDVITATNIQHNAWVAGTFGNLEYARGLDAKVGLMLVVSGALSSGDLAGFAALGGRLLIAQDQSHLTSTPADVAVYRAAGCDVSAYTITDSNSAKALLEIGVSRIIGDVWVGV